MSTENRTYPHVFIIESMDLRNEAKNKYEGQIISNILHLMDIEHSYYYVRTRQEFEHFLKEFETSKYRYLHLSCHGSSNAIHLTLDDINFEDLGFLLQDKLDKKRLFISSCLSTNKNLAKQIFPVSDCNSIIGPYTEIDIDTAAIFWAAFYQILLKRNPKAMKKEGIKDVLKSITKLFNLPINYFSHSPISKEGFKQFVFNQAKESC